MTKILESIGCGGLRQQVFSNIVIKDLDFSFGSPIAKTVDQLIMTSAGGIKGTQTHLKQILQYYDQYDLEAYHDRIDTIDHESIKAIFPKIKHPIKKHGVFQAPYNGTVLPKIINEEFNNPKLADFEMRAAFTVFGELPDGRQTTRLATSYDHPNTPLAPFLTASCAFPLYLPGETVKSEWLGDEPGNDLILFDGGIKCPHPVEMGLEELEKVTHEDEKIIAFSIIMHDRTTFDLEKLQKGGFYHWITPSRKCPLVRGPFDGLIENAERGMQNTARRSKGQIEYYSFFEEITDQDRQKYGVSFGSDDSSDDNIAGFKELSLSKLKLDGYKENKEKLLTALQISQSEKEDPMFNETMTDFRKNGAFDKTIDEQGVVPLNALSGKKSIPDINQLNAG